MTIQKSLSEITWSLYTLSAVGQTISRSDQNYKILSASCLLLFCCNNKNLFVCSHLMVECLLALEMLLPVTADERLFPLWRSSIDRFQGLDLSTEFSVLFSELSPSYLSNAQQQGLRTYQNKNIILFFVHPPKTYFICGHGTFAYMHCKNYNPNPNSLKKHINTFIK